MRGIARRFPHISFPIMTGISAGAINTTQLAACDSPFPRAAEELVALWLSLSPERVYDVRAATLIRNALRWGARLISGGIGAGTEPMRGMVDTEPLRTFLGELLSPAADGSFPGIARNIARGSLSAVAISATSYANGQSVTWVEGRDIGLWQRPQRRSELTKLGVEHIMASSALPMLFPAIRVGQEYFGDGGIRLTAPLSPALHLGATRILTISTRFRAPHAETDPSAEPRYPPPAQVFGMLYRSVFLDMIDEDIARLRKTNEILMDCPAAKREGWRVVDIFVIRPSQDLRGLVRALELKLPWFLRYMTRGLGTRETTSPDFLSLLLFQTDYIRRLIELGESDADAHANDIEAFLGKPAQPAS